jgi:peptidyl-dipeptidase Dcp
MDKDKKEIGAAVMNPLLEPCGTAFGAVPYDRIALEHFVPAVEECIRIENETIEEICNSCEKATFENTIAKFDYSGTRLTVVVCAFNALINARSHDKILAVEEEIQQLCTRHQNNISLNERLFTRIKEVYETDNSHLDTAQKRLLEQTYQSFVRGGANLKGEERDK